MTVFGHPVQFDCFEKREVAGVAEVSSEASPQTNVARPGEIKAELQRTSNGI